MRHARDEIASSSPEFPSGAIASKSYSLSAIGVYWPVLGFPGLENALLLCGHRLRWRFGYSVASLGMRDRYDPSISFVSSGNKAGR
jgi:hypothetical protein